jgi:hypothetical protein
LFNISIKKETLNKPFKNNFVRSKFYIYNTIVFTRFYCLTFLLGGFSTFDPGVATGAGGGLYAVVAGGA